MLQKDYCLRPMTEDDLDKVMHIELRAFPAPWTVLAYALELRHNKDAFYMVLETKQEGIVGYIGVWCIDEVSQIVRVAVGKEHRRQGWAARLLEKATHIAVGKGAQVVTLEVRESNAAAIAFYESQGFSPIDRIKGFYTNPDEDAICLLKTLSMSS